MNATEQMIRDSEANYNLRLARKHGEISICQTARGLLSLTHENGVYTLTACGMNPETLASGKPAVVHPVLASMFVIVAA